MFYLIIYAGGSKLFYCTSCFMQKNFNVFFCKIFQSFKPLRSNAWEKTDSKMFLLKYMCLQCAILEGLFLEHCSVTSNATLTINNIIIRHTSFVFHTSVIRHENEFVTY